MVFIGMIDLMRKLLVCMTVCLGVGGIWAQKPVSVKTLSLFQGKNIPTYTLFTASSEIKEDLRSYIETGHILRLSEDILQQLRQEAPGLVRLQLPEPLNISLDLYRADVFGAESKIMTSDGRVLAVNPHHLFYRGIIQGDPASLAIVSVFEERVQILFADAQGNRRIQKNKDGNYVTFRDRDILIPKQLECFTEELDDLPKSESGGTSSGSRMTGTCIEVYVECDFKSYQDNGSSVPNTEEWVAELWNEVITLYENESIPVAVSDVFVYTSTDPFASYNTTSAVLGAFRTHIAGMSYNGRLAHLLSTRTLGGGIAYLDVLCSNSYQVAFSASLSTSIQEFPIYSWTVEVVTHEMGHNIGSQHTHACVWNGNNTQVDDCGNQWASNNGYTPEGNACYNPNNPIIPPSGTIMSYCHLIAGVGINFNNGFGTEPGNRIRSKYNSAPCNTGDCGPPGCTSLTFPAPLSSNVDINENLTWNPAGGATGYRLTIGTSPTNGSILNNVDVGLITTYDPVNPLPFNTTIYVKIVPYNAQGDATGCSNQTFTTEPNTAPQCTQVTQPANGSTNVSVDVIIKWNHSVGNQTGYKISIGTTLNGTQILNQLNVGNVTSYDHPSSFPYETTLYVKITPYWAGGDINGCASQSFTTLTLINGDLCTNAIMLPCDGSISGNTSSATPDPGLPSCGTSVDAPGLWYTFTGNGENVIITTCSQYSYDTKLNAYSGSCGNLTCVAGNDDFCNTGSLLNFATTNGTNYFILVQGWNGQQGSFTITRSCYDGPLYCASQGNSNTFEWIKTVSLGSFTKQSAASNYSSFLHDTITVSRGDSYTLQITPGFSQNPRNEYYRVWVDLNRDGDFADSGEQVFSTGPSTGTVSGTITIPVTATSGITRMRVSMRYNQAPAACDAFAFGEVEDYTLNIRCNMVTTTSDSGNGSLRNVSNCVSAGEDVLFAPSLNGQIINVTAGSITCNGQWKWMAAAGSNIEIKASGVSRILSIPAGKSVEIQNLKLVGGTATNGSAIDNAGTLTLRDCDVHRAVGSNASPIRNTGMMHILGVCDIRF